MTLCNHPADWRDIGCFQSLCNHPATWRDIGSFQSVNILLQLINMKLKYQHFSLYQVHCVYIRQSGKVTGKVTNDSTMLVISRCL